MCTFLHVYFNSISSILYLLIAFEQFLDGIIAVLRKLWPGCLQVKGNPCHSKTNGGVERSNRTVECKVGSWMTQNNYVCWSVGLLLVQWEMNTQVHRAIGNQMPYNLMFGQNPRVGISNLPLDPLLFRACARKQNFVRCLGLRMESLLKKQSSNCMW